MDAGHSDRKNVRSTSISCLLPSLNDLKGSDTFVSFFYPGRHCGTNIVSSNHIIDSFGRHSCRQSELAGLGSRKIKNLAANAVVVEPELAGLQ